MRFSLKSFKNLPSAGDYRLRHGFLFFPRSLEEELRWLEQARWEEQYVRNVGRDIPAFVWKATRWMS